MKNETIVDLKVHEIFFAFVYNQRLSGKYYRYLYCGLILVNILGIAFSINAIIKFSGLQFEYIQGTRDLLMLIFAPLAIGLLSACFFYSRQRAKVYRFALPVTLITLFLLTVGEKSFQIFSLVFVLFAIIIYRTNAIPKKVALSNFEKRGVATYDYTFDGSQVSVEVSDFSKELSEEGEVVTHQNIRQFTCQYSQILEVYQFENFIFLKIDANTYLIVDNTKFEEANALSVLENRGLKIKQL